MLLGSQKPEARSQKPEARSQKPEMVFFLKEIVKDLHLLS